MFNKRVACFVLVLFLLLPTTVVQAATVVDKSQLESGIVSIQYDVLEDVPFKVMISKGESRYFYNLNGKNLVPLQMGDGDYTISVLENIKGNEYRIVNNERVNLKLSNENAVYLQSMQLINWDEDMEVVKKARELTVNAKDDYEKLEIVHAYVVHNIKYDYQKYSQLKNDYIPTIDDIDREGKGICYDYATLTAAMLRSLEVPTKLIMGYRTGVREYHAWNQVYIDGEWITIDTTFDAGRNRWSKTAKINKNPNLYSVLKEY